MQEKTTPTEKVYKIVLKTIKKTEDNVANAKKTNNSEDYINRKFLKNELCNLHEIRRRIELISISSNLIPKKNTK